MTPSQLNTLAQNNDRITLIKALRAMKLWTPQEKKYLMDHFNNMKIRDIAIELNRPEMAITKKAVKMGLRKNETVKTKPQPIKRPPAVYSNINYREQLLNQYAPV